MKVTTLSGVGMEAGIGMAFTAMTLVPARMMAPSASPKPFFEFTVKFHSFPIREGQAVRSAATKENSEYRTAHLKVAHNL